MIEKFDVRVSEAVLDDLKERLARTRWPDQMDGVGWDYGTELGTVKELCEYWRDKFDWRRVEAELGRYEHGATQIDGQRVYFLHARSKHEGAFPLVITHGWPGSVAEFVKIIGPLTDPAAHGADPADAFDVVCPSMPGYGFSDHPPAPGMEQERIAAEVDRLLTVASEVEADTRRDIMRLHRLRQSILKWAFEGRLVDQDPNDEPASVLLDRIRTEPEFANNGPPRRPRRAKVKSAKQ